MSAAVALTSAVAGTRTVELSLSIREARQVTRRSGIQRARTQATQGATMLRLGGQRRSVGGTGVTGLEYSLYRALYSTRV